MGGGAYEGEELEAIVENVDLLSDFDRPPSPASASAAPMDLAASVLSRPPAAGGANGHCRHRPPSCVRAGDGDSGGGGTAAPSMLGAAAEAGAGQARQFSGPIRGGSAHCDHAPRGAGAGARDRDEFEVEEGDTASLHKFWHRAGWLVLLLMCQSTSSVILEHFELLIRKHPVVIYFLTMLVGAGGNAGSQSTVLVVRRLALAATQRGRGREPERFSVRRIVGSEVSVGARLSLVLFVGTFVRCIVFQVRGVECLAICLSMLAIVFTSTIVGAALPLLLNRMKMDPAHAGATIQVVMDISGVTLTCIVSCLVLGLPLSSPAAGPSTSVAPSPAETDFFVGQHKSLSAFGGKAVGASAVAIANSTAGTATRAAAVIRGAIAGRSV